MEKQELNALAENMLAAWTSQDVDAVLACYTDDLVYIDPNTRGAVEESDGMRRYLTKLFDNWKMTWSLRSGYPLVDPNGAAVLWRATFQRAEGSEAVVIDGMDYVLLRGDRIAHNEVYFDRTALAPLLAEAVV